MVPAMKGNAINHRSAAGVQLESRLFAAWQQAIGEGRWQVAEHLLKALEELSTTDPSAGGAVEQAYLVLAECGFTAAQPRH